MGKAVACVLLGLMLSVAAGAAPDAALMNPVLNAGFERLSADGTGLADWRFSVSRNALCTVGGDPRGGRGGSQAAAFHNESPISPNVYGRFTQRVGVLPNMTYKLSFWCKGDCVAGGDHWTDWKSYTVSVPSGTFDWVRREAEFTTAPDQTALELGLNLCNVIGKLWIDDVSLVPDYTEARAAGGRLLLWAPRTLRADKEELAFRVGWLDLPKAAVTIRLRVMAAGQTLGAAEMKASAPGAEFIDHLKVTPAPEGAGTVVAEALDGQGQALITATREVSLLSDLYARQRLEGAKAQLAALRGKMQQWRQRGLPTDYPAVTETVADNFIPWLAEDLDHGELARALQQINELDQILRDALAQCYSPRAEFPIAPDQ